MCKLSRHARDRCHEYGIDPKDVERQVIGLENAPIAIGKLVKVSSKATDEAAAELASKLQLTLATLPEGEATATSDFLILIGEDKIK